MLFGTEWNGKKNHLKPPETLKQIQTAGKPTKILQIVLQGPLKAQGPEGLHRVNEGPQIEIPRVHKQGRAQMGCASLVRNITLNTHNRTEIVGITMKRWSSRLRQTKESFTPTLPLRLYFEALAMVQLGLQILCINVQIHQHAGDTRRIVQHRPSSISARLRSTARNMASRFFSTHIFLIIFFPTRILSPTCQSCTSLDACYGSALLPRIPNTHSAVLLYYSNSILFDLSRFTSTSHSGWSSHVMSICGTLQNLTTIPKKC